MKQEELSAGSAIFGQVLILLFSVLFTPFCFYIFLNNLSIKTLFMLLFIMAIIIVLIKNALSYADIYLLEEKILIKKITGNSIRSRSDIELIGEGWMPFTFFIRFMDGKKVYFQYKPKDSVGNFFIGGSTDSIAELKNRLKELDH